MSQTELKPCPFCGGEAKLEYSHDNKHMPYIYCFSGCFQEPKCPVSNVYHWNYKTVEDAIKAWNSRAYDRISEITANYFKQLTEADLEYAKSIGNGDEIFSCFDCEHRTVWENDKEKTWFDCPVLQQGKCPIEKWRYENGGETIYDFKPEATESL